MSVWAIADLHLSFARPDRRERYAARWRDHAARIEREWRAVVGRDDLVLLPGDLSMARNHRDLQPDLAWIDRLPGTKVLAPGNHDRWWNGAEKVRPMLRASQLAVGGDAVAAYGAIVCGTLGVPPAADPAALTPQRRRSRSASSPHSTRRSRPPRGSARAPSRSTSSGTTPRSTSIAAPAPASPGSKRRA